MKQRCCQPYEEVNDVFPRVARALSNVTDEKYYKPFLNMMENLDWLPNSPTLKNADGNNYLKACFCLGIEDSMESIFSTLRNVALIQKGGGGIGINFSLLRERGAPLSSGGTSSGVMSFMHIFDSLTDAVKQGGMRRGANMFILEYDHPQILDFVTEKIKNNTLNNANLSVLVNDEFMRGVKNGGEVIMKSKKDKRRVIDKMSSADLFNIICYSAWLRGDPGLLFFESLNRDNPFFPNEVLKTTNPCGEVPLFCEYNKISESCTLGSINLANHLTKDRDIDYDKLINTIEYGTRFLLAVNKLSEFPIEECYKGNYKYNRIGLGVMGFADMLMKMGIIYDSKETLSIIDKIARRMKRYSRKIAVNSVATLSIAPTGSLSILADCSSGIEPIFSTNYERHITIGKISERREHSEYLRTAHDVPPIWHLKIQARWQKWVDNGVSKTVNLPYTATIRDVADVYYRAWKMGCKGITVFRDGCLNKQVYNKISKCDGDTCYL